MLDLELNINDAAARTGDDCLATSCTQTGSSEQHVFMQCDRTTAFAVCCVVGISTAVRHPSKLCWQSRVAPGNNTPLRTSIY